jgi:hypothetical protein
LKFYQAQHNLLQEEGILVLVDDKYACHILVTYKVVFIKMAFKA